MGRKNGGRGFLEEALADHLTDPDRPLLDPDFDGRADILAEDLIAELGNDGRGITNSSTL